MSDEIRTEQLDDEKEHERLRKIVEEKMPPEEDIYDLAELFKTFGVSPPPAGAGGSSPQAIQLNPAASMSSRDAILVIVLIGWILELSC